MADTWKQALDKLKSTCGGDVMKVFDAIDADGSGEIDHDEITTALAKLGFSEAESKAALAFADSNGDGSISKNEWSALVQKC